MSAANTHAVEARLPGLPWRHHRSFPSFDVASAVVSAIVEHERSCSLCRGIGAEWRIVELDAGGTFEAPSSLAAVAEQIKRTLETKLGANVRVFNIDDLLKPAPEPKPAPAPEPEEWGIFIDHGDGNGFYEDKGPRLPTKADAEARARFTEASCRLLGVPTPKWEVRRVVSPAAEIAMLRARVSTLVEAEARAVAGEKAAREALAKIDVKRIRDLAFELRHHNWTNTAEHLLAAIGDEPKVEA